VPSSVQDRKQQDRKIGVQGLAISLLLHLLLLLIAGRTPVPESPFSAAGPRERDDRAAAGSMVALTLREVGAPDPVRPPPPLLVEPDPTEPVEVEPEATPEVALERPDVPTPGTREVAGADPSGREAAESGLPGAEGRGDAGTSEEGRFRVVPPRPRGMIVPPTQRSMRGQQIQVWVFVAADGRVVPDSTRLEPATSDRAFNRRLMEDAAQWVFEPARQNGQAVASWFPYTISLREE